jgi:hypothetical protein
MAAKAPEKKVVRLVYLDPHYAGPGLQTGDHEWLEEIGPHANDDGTMATARAAVMAYTAAWVAYLMTGEMTGLWKPPTTVEAVGLPYDRKTQRRSVLWQVEGMALVEAAGLTDLVAAAAAVPVTDYRDLSAGRMRRSSPVAARAAAWCDAYDRKKEASGENIRPTMPMPQVRHAMTEAAATDPGEEALRFYREAMVSGEVG